VEDLGSGLWSVPVPIPDNPLGYTLVYLLETAQGPVLVDAGWDDPTTWQALTEGIGATGASVEDVYGVLVTHYHPDHHGLAGAVRDASGAWIAMHPADTNIVKRQRSSSLTDSADWVEKLGHILHAAGVPEEEMAALADVRNRVVFDAPVLPDREIADDELSEEIRLYNRIRSLVRKISALRKRDNPPLTGRDFLEVTRAFHLLEPEELVVRLAELHERLAAVPDDGARPLRLMMTGGIVAEGDRRILDLIEDEIGARIVVEDHCTGFSPFVHDTDEQGDPWQALANAYLDQAPCARQSPLERRVAHAAALAREYRVDAVVYTYLKFCPCYGMTKAAFTRRFQELELPVLELGNDYSRGDTGQIKTRLEAFVEVLHEKEVA